MVAINPQQLQTREDQVAKLTQAAYHAILERGYRGSFLELELSLWNTLRHIVEHDAILKVRLAPFGDKVA